MIDINQLCQNCLSETDRTAAFCQYCGKNPGEVPERSNRCLPQYTILAGRYLIGRVLGEGGFGITYLAIDLIQEERVAIKEYFPVDLVSRDISSEQAGEVIISKGEAEVHFKNGMRRFESEAQTLKKLELLPGIVAVQDFFRENNTAYLVMEYIEGGNLKTYLKQYTVAKKQTIPYKQAFVMMRPVLDSLRKIHAAGIIHRDISPENILLDKNGELVLIDFGSAKTNLASRENRSMTVMVKHGYAPEEQYRTHGDQGPWTDIYAACATLYHMISGILPEDAIERLIGDRLVPLKKLKLTPEVPVLYSDIIQKGMQILAKNRYQSMDEMIAELDQADRVEEEARRKAAEEEARRKEEQKAEENKRKAAEEARRRSEKNRQELNKALERQKQKKQTGIRIAIAIVVVVAALALLLGTLRSGKIAPQSAKTNRNENSAAMEASSATSESPEEKTISAATNSSLADISDPDDREWFIQFAKKYLGIDSEITNKIAFSSDAEFYQSLMFFADECEKEDPLIAAILYGRIDNVVKEIGGEALCAVMQENSVRLWQQYGSCNDIDYRTQRIAAINEDGTVKALCSPWDAEDFSEVENWENIVSVVFKKMGGELYGLKTDGTLVCNDFQCEEFAELTDVIGLTAVKNGYVAALCANGTVCFDKMIGGKMYKIEDSAWHDIKYISGGYASIVGVRVDGTIIESYLPYNEYTVTETVEISNYKDENIIKITNEGAIMEILNDQGEVHILSDPLEEIRSSGSFWMTEEDVERISSFHDIVDIENAVFLHADGTVEGFGWAWYTAQDWEDVSDICWGNGHVFAVLKDGSIKYYDAELSEEDYLAYLTFNKFLEDGRINWGAGLLSDHNILVEIVMEFTGLSWDQFIENNNFTITAEELSDIGLADVVNWTGLRTRSLKQT